MMDKKYVWVRYRASFKHGPGSWQYKEMEADGDLTPEDLKEIVEDMDEQEGDPEGIRSGEAEQIPYPPAEWMLPRIAAIPERVQELLDRKARMEGLVKQAEKELPWSVGDKKTGKLLGRFASLEDANAWLYQPRNMKIDPDRLEAGEYWVRGPEA